MKYNGRLLSMMLVLEAKLKNGTPKQYALLEDAILTGQFVRNKCVRYWMEHFGVTRNDLQKLCAVLAKDKTKPWESPTSGLSVETLRI